MAGMGRQRSDGRPIAMAAFALRALQNGRTALGHNAPMVALQRAMTLPQKQTSGPALVGRKQRAKKVDSGQLFQNSDRQRCARSGPEDPSSAPMASTEPNATTVIRFAVIEMTP